MWGSPDPFLDPVITRGRKLETSNLAQTWMAASTNEKMQNWVKRVMWGSCDPLLECWDPIIYRGRMKLETTKLAQSWMTVSTNEKNAKLGRKGSCGGSHDPLTEFCYPNISGTNELRNFKFGT